MTTAKLTSNETLRNVFGTTTRATVARILATYALADDATRTAGTAWYSEAGQHADILATRHGTTREHAATVIAHLSPRTSWARNVAGAYALYETGTAPHCMGGNVTRALVAMGSDNPLATLNGKKTAAFARNILGDADAVTVDVWALRVALPDTITKQEMERGISRVGVYAAIERAYVIAADRVGVSPAVMQATTWIVQRNGRSE